MTKYTLNVSKKEERPWTIHPVWRGIGCIWLIILPVMSYIASWLLIRRVIFGAGFQSFLTQFSARNGFNLIPPDLYQRVSLPSVQIGAFYFNFNTLIRWLPGQPLYQIDFLFWGMFILLGFGISTVLYAFLYRSFGPPRSPYEAVETKRYRGPYGD